MFDYRRIAGLVMLTLGAAGASGQILPGPPGTNAVEPVAAFGHSRLSPAIVENLGEDVVNSSTETTNESLPALVRRHASSQTASAEQECLAIATYFEAKGEPLPGQLAVARVILNRAASGRFANTACGVVKQRGQFSFVRAGTMPIVARSSANWRTAVAIAHIAENNMWAAPAATALYFHAKRVSPAWGMTRLASVGNHVFYR